MSRPEAQIFEMLRDERLTELYARLEAHVRAEHPTTITTQNPTGEMFGCVPCHTIVMQIAMILEE